MTVGQRGTAVQIKWRVLLLGIVGVIAVVAVVARLNGISPASLGSSERDFMEPPRRDAEQTIRRDRNVEEPRQQQEAVAQPACDCSTSDACPYGKVLAMEQGRCCECIAIPQAPEEYSVLIETTKGSMTLDVHRPWSPRGADRFFELVQLGFCEQTETTKGLAFFRVVPDFIIQFGIHGDPKTASYWQQQSIKDDPVTQTNSKGRITFATAGPDTRTTQLFFNLKDNAFLDKQGFSPFGEIVSGSDVLQRITSEYGERPNQGRIQGDGARYLESEFPNLDYITHCKIVKSSSR